jgi:signal transduction histidine kinase
MTFTPRRRALIALLAFLPLAGVYGYFAFFTAENLGRWYRGGYGRCDGSWRDYLNNCGGQFNAPLAWAELLGGTAVLLVIAYGLARWIAAPIRDIADAVASFGPTSLGVRLRAGGPRDETRALSDAIDAMLDRLAAGYEAQRRFASNASHELRTPLATQRALIEVSLADALTAEQLDLLSRQLLATNERNERLVDGLLTLAETDQGLMSRTPIRLDAVLSNAISLQSQLAAARGITINAAIEPATVYGEAALLERLAANLLENAIKYNDTGGRVEVTVRADGSFTVANSGPRVPGEQVPALFEPFRRLAGERLDHGAGVGLGLTIVRSIVAAHAGSVDARANPDGGLTVTVRLVAAAG